jgi:Holliday junction DNA helicase RuvA
MIALLTGILLHKSTRSVIIDNGGIGYEVIIPLSTFYALPEREEGVSLHIYTHVREDALALFGFHTPLEKDLFMMLISVSGIGPKLAVNVLSGIGPDDLLEAMARGDAIKLQSIPGVGRKMSERIALELRDKALNITGELQVPLAQPMSLENKRVLDDALSALLNLGYPARSAKSAVENAFRGTEKVTLEGLIKEALRRLA